MKQLHQQILEFLNKGSQNTTTIRANISGTRGDIVDALYNLRELIYVEIIPNSVPRCWRLTARGLEALRLGRGSQSLQKVRPDAR